ncbi:MAG: DUF5797 family protein [Halanaeroarchaeum sp.]
MSLSEEALDRLADIVELQPTKNKDLQERWGMDDGSAVHQYLESELRDYYYRDEDSLIRATAAAEALVSGEPEPEDLSVHLSALEADLLDVVPGPEDRSASVVSVYHDLDDPEVDIGEVRRALQTLSRKGVLEKVTRTVPTFRLAIERERITSESEG